MGYSSKIAGSLPMWLVLVFAQWVVVDVEIVGFLSGVLHIMNTLNYSWPLVLTSLASILVVGQHPSQWRYAFVGLVQGLGVVISANLGQRGNTFSGATGFVMQGLEMFALLLATTLIILNGLDWKVRDVDLRKGFREAVRCGYSPVRFLIFTTIIVTTLPLGAALYTGPFGDVGYLVTAFRYGAIQLPGIFTLVIIGVGVWVLGGATFRRLPRWATVMGMATASGALVIAQKLCHIAVMGNSELTIESWDDTVTYPGMTPVSVALSAVSMFVTVVLAAMFRAWTVRNLPTSSPPAVNA